MITLAICSTCRPCSARPSRSAFSAAGVFGPQSISVTGPSVKTYTLAGPTLNGVGTMTRWKNDDPVMTGAHCIGAARGEALCAEPFPERLRRLRALRLALAARHERLDRLVLPAV